MPAAFTVMHCVVALLLHKYFMLPAGAHNCVVAPVLMVLLPVIVQTGNALTVTVFEQELVHPAALVTLTV